MLSMCVMSFIIDPDFLGQLMRLQSAHSADISAIAMAFFVFTLCLLLANFQCRKEQRACIKMCVRLGYSQAKTFRQIQEAWGDDALGRTQVRYWHQRFSDDPAGDVGDKKHTG